MYKAKFLRDIKNIIEDFTFKKGKKYEIILKERGLYYIKQPNCPKNRNWVTTFPVECENDIFQVVRED